MTPTKTLLGSILPRGLHSLRRRASLIVCQVESHLKNAGCVFDEQISLGDPVVQLGCMCLGDNGLAHESCIRKWFPQRLLETGRYDCEICKTQLGNHAISIFMQGLRPTVYQHLFRRQITRVLASSN